MPDSQAQLIQQTKKAALENAKNNIFQSNSESTGYNDVVSGGLFVPKSTLANPNAYEQYDRLGSFQAPTVGGNDAASYSKYMRNPEGVAVGTDIDALRARNQSGWEQAKNLGVRLVPNILMGTIGNLAAIADVGDYWNTDDEVSNGLSNYMQELQQQFNANVAPIYQENPGKSFDLGDSGYIFENISNLLNSAGSFIATGMITGGILSGMSKAMQTEAWAAKTAAKLGLPQKAASLGLAEGSPEWVGFMQKGLSQYRSTFDKASGLINTLALNQAEGTMEAYQISNDVLNKKLDEGSSYEEAKKSAADAATLDMLLNRTNILLNITSAGAFTKAGSALEKAAKGGKWNILGETAQESLEEGVNYVAQKEAMQQAEDGDNYQFDMARAAGHLTDIQGIESMVLGGLGGALQTAGTSAAKSVFGAKAHSDAVQKDLDATRAAQGKPTATEMINKMHNKLKVINTWLEEKKNAPDEAAYHAADAKITDMFIDDIEDKRATGATVAGFTQILNDEKATPEQKATAQSALDKIKVIQDVANSVNESEMLRMQDKTIIGDVDNTPKYLNKTEIIREEVKKRELEDLKKKSEEAVEDKKRELENDLNSPDQAVVAEANKKLDILLKEDEKIAKSLEDQQKHINYLKNEKQVEIVKERRAEKAKKDQLLKDAALNKNKGKSAPSQDGVVHAKKQTGPPPSGSNGGSYTLPGNPDITYTVPPRVHNREKQGGTPLSAFIPTIGHTDSDFKLKEGPITETEFNELAEPNTITFVKDKDGDYFAIMPPIAQENDPTTGNVVTLPAQIIRSTDVGTDGKPLGVPLMKRILQENSGFKGNVRIGDLLLGPDDPIVKGEINDVAGIKQHLMDLHPSPLPGAMQQAEKQPVQQAPTPGAPVVQQGEPVSPREIEAEVKTESSPSAKRAVAAAVNYLAVQYRMASKVVKGVARRIISDVSGEARDNVNDMYLIHGDDRAIKAGSKIIFKVATSATVADRASGKTEFDKDGNLKTKVVHPGAIREEFSKSGKAVDEDNMLDVPIEIWTVDDNGKTENLIGYLPERSWLDAGVQGNRDHHLGTEEEVARINAIRQQVESKFLETGNVNDSFVDGVISDISAGRPYLGGEVDSVNKKMPDLSNDLAKLGMTTRFGYYDNGGLKVYGMADIEGIVANAEEFRNKWKSKTGMPIMLIPSRDGKVYVVPAWSKTLTQDDAISITHGIQAAANITGSESTSKYNNLADRNGAKHIDSLDGLREYLRQFIHLNTVEDINTADMGEILFMVNANENGDDIYVSAERVGEEDTVYVSVNDLNGKNGAAKQEKANRNLEAVAEIISNSVDGGRRAARRNFHLDYTNKKAITFEDDGFGNYAPKVGKTFGEIYGDTLQTNVTHAGRRDGKNIYMVQQVTQFSADTAPEIKPVEPPASPTKVSPADVRRFADVLAADGMTATDAIIENILSQPSLISGNVSTAAIQRMLSIGYNHAGRIADAFNSGQATPTQQAPTGGRRKIVPPTVTVVGKSDVGSANKDADSTFVDDTPFSISPASTVGTTVPLGATEEEVGNIQEKICRG